MLCHRLKGLLPQTEVGSGCVESEQQRKRLKRSHSQKKSAEDDKLAAESSDDSWSTGDESIDEFTSTGEPASSVEADRTVFTHNQSHSTHLSLPSLIAVEDTRSSPPPSADSGATLGTLVQSPIDLSLSPSLGSVAISQSSLIGASIASNTRTISNASSSPKEDGPGSESEEKELGCDKETCDSPSEVGTPHSKRVRLSEEGFPVSRKLFIDTAACSEQVAKEEVESDEEEDDDKGEDDEIDPHENSFLIDLTEDEEDDTLVSPEPPELIDLTCDQPTPPAPGPTSHTGRKPFPPLTPSGGVHHTPNVVHGLRLSSPVVLELSDSQTSSSMSGSSVHSRRSASVESTSRGLGSPNCLPPTPGRENVHSILQRPDFP